MCTLRKVRTNRVLAYLGLPLWDLKSEESQQDQRRLLLRLVDPFGASTVGALGALYLVFGQKPSVSLSNTGTFSCGSCSRKLEHGRMAQSISTKTRGHSLFASSSRVAFRSDDDAFYLFLQKQKSAPGPIYSLPQVTRLRAPGPIYICTSRKVHTIRGCLQGLALIVCKSRMALAAPAPSSYHRLLPPPRRPLSGHTPPKLDP